MTVEMKNGAKVSFLLEDSPVITFQSGNLVVNKDAETTYSFESIKNYHFTEQNEGGGTTKANEAYADALQIVWLDNETVEVRNAQPNLSVRLFSVNGAAMAQTVTDTDGKAAVSVPNKAGVYVISAGNQSFKIIRK